MCGNDDTMAKSAESTSLSFTKTLQDLFSSQFGKQSAILDFLNSKLTSQVENPTGLQPGTLSALRTGASTTTATQYQNALKGVQGAEASNGSLGSPVESGVDKQIAGQLAGQEAGALSGELNNIQLENEQAKQNNYWNAIKSLSGTAALENPDALAQGANQGSNATADLSKAYSASESADPFSSAFGSALGKFAGGGDLSFTKAV